MGKNKGAKDARKGKQDDAALIFHNESDQLAESLRGRLRVDEKGSGRQDAAEVVADGRFRAIKPRQEQVYG